MKVPLRGGQRALLSSSSESWHRLQNRTIVNSASIPTGKSQKLDMTGVHRFVPRLEEHGKTLSAVHGVTRLGNPMNYSMWGHSYIVPQHDNVSPDQHLFGHMSKLIDPLDLISFDKLMDAGGHHGHRKEMMNPKMADFIFGERRGWHILDMYNTLATVRQVCRMAQYVILNGGQILWVCYDDKMKPMTDHYATLSGQPFMIDRWRPGFFTNHEEVFYNCRNARKLFGRPGEGHGWMTMRRNARRQYFVNAFSTLRSVPSLCFFTNMKKTASQVKEAGVMQIPCIGIVDSDCDPTGLTYPIPLNDENHVAVGLVLKTVALCMKDAMDYKKRINEETGMLFEHFPTTNFGTSPPDM
jgi:small subunit ribosomal protein S2